MSDQVITVRCGIFFGRAHPSPLCSVAYMDGPVLIGQGQTISQPFIVALMTQLAAVKFDELSWKSARVQVTRPQYWRVW